MEFGLLGPLMVGDSGSRVTVTAGKQRVVLAALLLRANQVVPAGDLAEAVWEGHPPPTARVTLQNYVKRLRQALGPTGYERIVTLPAGYLIRIGAGELDLARFEELAAAGSAAAAAGEWQRACDRLGAALRLWRGDPLADVPSTVLATQAARLAGMRLDAAEVRFDAELHAGRHREVAGELRSLVAAAPLRERPAELLMLALYRSGEPAGALEVYRRTRRRLVERAGIEPGPALRELNQRVRRSDPGLLLPPGGASGAAGAAGRVIRPGLLPSGVAGFTGRSRALRELSAAMAGAGGGQEQGAAPVVITAVGGTAGVGKTALAVHWARQHAAEFPGGQLYVNMRGFGPGDPVPPEEALRGFLEALQVPAAQVPATLHGMQGLYRRLLAGQRMLVLLDNVRDAGQVRPLLPGTPETLVLLTSRSDLASLAVTDGARQMFLDVLTAAEARQVLARRLGAARLAAEPQAVGELIELCARLPLALAVTAARAAVHPSFPLAALAAELRDVRGRLDVLSTGEEDATDVRAVLSWSYRRLSPEAAQMFRLLGLHPGPDITVPAAASLASLDPQAARRLLRELTRGCLLAEPAPGRYAFHDLLRAYAAEQAAADDPATRRDVTSRMLDHYLHTAHGAALLLSPSREPVAIAPARPGVSPERLAGHQQARDWFHAEHQVLLAVIALGGEARFDSHAWQLPWAMFNFLDGRGLWRDQASVQHIALAAAISAGDMAGQAVTRRLSGHNCVRLGDYEGARANLLAGLELYRLLGDKAGEAWVHQALGYVSECQDRPAEALGHAERALALFREIGHRPGQADALNDVGWCHARLGDYRQAREFCRQALALHAELGNRSGQAFTWDSLGYAEQHLGEHASAVSCYRQSVDLLGELGNRVFEATVRARLGDAEDAVGNPAGAREAWRRALAILDDLHHPDAAGVRDKLRGLETAGAGTAVLSHG